MKLGDGDGLVFSLISKKDRKIFQKCNEIHYLLVT